MPTNEPLTLLLVHAHPDDEASSTGGVIAKYAREGIRVVLVTCTNGELGDAPDGTKPHEDGHDQAEVVRLRKAELEKSCEILGIAHLEMLGYHDSGMAGWEDNDAPEAFWNLPIEVGAARIVELIETFQPQVVVTYDENGFYGHPDHIKANQITLAALRETDVPKKVYYPTIPRSRLAAFGEAMVAAGAEPPTEAIEDPNFGSPDEDIAAVIDCGEFTTEKYAALEAHTSQKENMFFLDMGKDLFATLFGYESYLRILDKTGTPIVEDDLFAGLR